MSENIFPNGFIVKKPHQNAPSFVKSSIAIKADEFSEFMRNNTKQGWLNLQIKESREGKYYAVLDTYETPTDKVYEKTKNFIEQEVLQVEALPEEPKTTSKGFNGEDEIDPSQIPF